MTTETRALDEALALLNSVAADIKAAKADGIVDWRDTPKFMDLLPKAWQASKDAPLLASELAAVLHDTAALKDLLAKAVDAVAALTEAVVLKTQ